MKLIKDDVFTPDRPKAPIDNFGKGTAVLSVMGIILAIALVFIVPGPRVETASNDVSVGMKLDPTEIPDNQGPYADPIQAAFFLTSPNYCCATVVAEISAR